MHSQHNFDLRLSRSAACSLNNLSRNLLHLDLTGTLAGRHKKVVVSWLPGEVVERFAGKQSRCSKIGAV